jgi:hypothetical protein
MTCKYYLSLLCCLLSCLCHVSLYPQPCILGATATLNKSK